MKYNSIKPGQLWLDTNGKPIQCHGGALFYENGTYYWYGENKEKTDGKSKIWSWGVRCYSSKDLYNWEDRGLIIPPNINDKKSRLHPNNWLDRPHIIYNEKTKKYVCWLKFSGKIGCFGVMTSDTLMGSYAMVNDNLRPYGTKIGDFDIAIDSESGKAYIYFDYDHKGIVSMELTDDFCNTTGEPSFHYHGLYPPYCREGVTLFTRNNLHYILTSGMTGYVPNPSEAAVFTKWNGEITIQGNPHVNDNSSASFNSQISAVFKHPKKEDLYIVLADRWIPDYVMTSEKYEWIAKTISSRFDKSIKVKLKDLIRLSKTPMLGNADTSKSRYVWLPLRFDGDIALIEWKDEWKAEDY